MVDATNTSGAPTAMAWGDDTAWMACWAQSGGSGVYKRTGAGAWEYAGGATIDYGTQLVVDATGQAWTVTLSYGGGSSITVDKAGQGGTTVCSNDCAGAALRAGVDRSVHLVYSEAGSVKYRKSTGAGWPAPQTIDSGTASNLALSPAGIPVVSYAQGGNTLMVASGNGNGGWTKAKVLTAPLATEKISTTAIGVDTAGRYHFGLHGTTISPGGFSDDEIIRYAMYCPTLSGTCTSDCAGKSCGADGCGGTCGECDGQECVDGACQAGSSKGCEVKGTPSCGGCSCESCVCAADPYCCNTAWDGACVTGCKSCGTVCQ